MCGRYTVTATPEQLAEHFAAAPPSELIPRYNAAPSQNLPVLLNEGERRIELLHWGLIPHWSKGQTTGYSMINARMETLLDKPSYREAFTKRRCMVLADSFYEWQETADGKVPMRIMLKSGEPFAFAGLWDTWHDPDGQIIRSFTIITGEPNELIKPIHNRMPMILQPDNERLWLDNAAGTEAWHSLLQPYPVELMTAYPVSRRVNATSNDDPSLIAQAS